MATHVTRVPDMVNGLLKSLATKKYERLLPRVFPGAIAFEIRDRQGQSFWQFSMGGETDEAPGGDTDPVVVWSEFGAAR